ncbi:hypothetical protein FOA52_005304 [Chlamydomonas sp. UWO 241]|nr:hypothetical protein FOA52_005304 [Chlamydomonas sp. UWO 241]
MVRGHGHGPSRISIELDEDDISASGHVFLLQWLHEKWSTDAARNIMWQFLVFYGLLLCGFLFLWMMIRSTGQMRSKLKEVRRNVAELVRQQREQPFDLDAYNKTTAGYM